MIRKPLYIIFFAALNFFYTSSAEASSWWACCDINDAVPNTMIANGENSTKYIASTTQPNPEEVPRNTGNNYQQGNHTNDSPNSFRGSVITSGNTGNNARTFHSLSRENAFS